MRTVLATATGVIANSQATLDELAAFAAQSDCPAPPRLRPGLALDPLASSAASKEPERPTFVVLGTIEARKNHLMLLEIWSRLIDRLGDSAPRLLIIGQRGWEADPVFELLDQSASFEDTSSSSTTVRTRKWRSISRLRAHYFFRAGEGYGLPLIEALGLGVPVIASDLPVFREIGGDIPDYLARYRQSRVGGAILDYRDRAAGPRGATGAD